MSTTNDTDRKAVLRTFKQRTPQFWACFDKGLDAKLTLGNRLDVHFVIHDGAPAQLTATGVEATVDACLADVIREMRFAPMSNAGDVTVDAKIPFPKS